ncbi:MAG TPA: signal peptidase II [Gaiellaceae bacterium]|jgi:lipoprotein signal peptidase|nr:signal peptidase II [Gaiellaceae bacterium]
MQRLPTLDLPGVPSRVVLMVLAAALALTVDWTTKHVVVWLEPGTLLFHVSERASSGLGNGLILVAAGGSLLACVLPLRAVAAGAGLALGGALGNLTSRHWWGSLGGSPDFIPFADGSVGNVADLFIAFGVATMLAASTAWLLWHAFAGRAHA